MYVSIVSYMYLKFTLQFDNMHILLLIQALIEVNDTLGCCLTEFLNFLQDNGYV